MQHIVGRMRSSTFKKYYQIKVRLDSGEFGSVFSAVHTTTGQHVAIKFIEKDHVLNAE